MSHLSHSNKTLKSVIGAKQLSRGRDPMTWQVDCNQMRSDITANPSYHSVHW